LFPDIEKFLPAAIFKMATTIPQKFNIVRYHQNLICIIYPHIKFWWYRTMLNFYPPFLCRVLADILKILKTQNCSSNGDLSLCQNLCLYYRTEFHKTWWSYRYMFLVDPKVFRFVVKGVKAIFFGVQRGWRLL
jgi:hypothetical protein